MSENPAGPDLAKIYIYPTEPELVHSFSQLDGTCLFTERSGVNAGDIIIYLRYLHNSARWQLQLRQCDLDIVISNVNEFGVSEELNLDLAPPRLRARSNFALFLVNTWECLPTHHPVFCKNLSSLASRLGIPVSQVVVSSCNVRTRTGPRKTLRRIFYSLLPGIRTLEIDWGYLREKGFVADTAKIPLNACPSAKFVSLNRRSSPDRLAALVFLHASGLLDQGNVSYLQSPSELDCHVAGKFLEGLLDPGTVKEVLSDLEFPRILDDNYEQVDQYLMELPQESFIFRIFESSSFYFYHETKYESDGHLFLSEKTFKALRLGLPFIVFGQPYILQRLRFMGFRTFSPIIDESYDTELDDRKRFQMYLREMEKLVSLEPEDIESVRSTLRPVIEHNRCLFDQTEKVGIYGSQLSRLRRYLGVSDRISSGSND